MSSFKSKTSSIFVTIFIGIIVVSFMFTGSESMRGTPDAVAKVGDYSVSFSEYQNEYNRQVNFYKGVFGGGKELTQAQIQQFNIKNTALNNAVQRKLMLVFADDLSIVSSPAEVKKQIKEMPYFQTNGAFDINKYKGLLRANSFTPSKFEKQILQDIKSTQVRGFISSFPISNNYFKAIDEFKKQAVTATIVKIDKSKLTKFVAVSNKEITDFLKVEVNKARVNSIFSERKKALGKAEQVKASHILLKTEGKNEADVLKKITILRTKLTKSNFKKMANQNTEDDSGKNNGGKLGSFSKGQMVPEFDAVVFSMKTGEISEPVKTQFGYHIILKEGHTKEVVAKLADHQKEITKEQIQKAKKADVETLAKKVAKKVQSAIKSSSKLASLKSKYGLTVQSDFQVNKLDGVSGDITVSADNLKKVFANGLNQSKFYSFASPTGSILMQTSKAKSITAKEEDIIKEQDSLKSILGRKLGTDIIKELQASTSIEQYPHLLR